MRKEQLIQFLGESTLHIVEAMEKIDANAHGILFIVDKSGRLQGTVTDGDIRRWIIRSGKLDVTVADIMNKDPKIVYRGEESQGQDYMKKVQVKALPVLDAEGKVTDIILDREDVTEMEKRDMKTLREVPVVVMAGGKGTRLYPYTKILPKPLIPIGDIPIMERIIDKFVEYGVTDFYATVNYKKSMIKSYFADLAKEYSIQYVEEDKPLGTAGSLRLIDTEFECPIIVTNCDILIHADYADIYKYHKESGNAITIVSALKNIVVPYGVIHSKENGTVISMKEKPKLSYFVNTGMYVLNPDLLQKIPEDTFFHMTDLTDLLIQEGKQVGMYPISEDSFLDMGEFEEMRRMEKKLNLKSE